VNVPQALDRWVAANLIDRITADRILQFEKDSTKEGLRWPALLAIGFGALMLCAGILLFVAAHWDRLSPGQRFALVVVLVALFHLAAAGLGQRSPSVGIALHLAGTACLGAGIYMAAQIFNLEEHWPGGILLWALGAVLAWLVLRQWPQALLAAVLIPCWLVGEWALATEGYRGAASNIAAQGLLLLALLYVSASPRGPNRTLRMGLVWVGGLALIPFMAWVMFSGESAYPYRPGNPPALPTEFVLLGYASAYLPALALAFFIRKSRSLPILVGAVWVALLGVLSRQPRPEHNPAVYVLVGLGACAFCYWGVGESRKLFINLGTAIFAMNLITFYFSDVLDKLDRSLGLILLGILFLAGGWFLNRVRGRLIASAAAEASP
jgi:uncharacterized membrane protein